MIILKPEAKFFSVGATIGATLSFFISFLLPNLIIYFLVLYLILAGVGVYKLKDEFYEVFR